MFSTQDKTLGSMITARQAPPTFRSSGKKYSTSRIKSLGATASIFQYAVAGQAPKHL